MPAVGCSIEGVLLPYRLGCPIRPNFIRSTGMVIVGYSSITIVVLLLDFDPPHEKQFGGAQTATIFIIAESSLTSSHPP